MIDTALRAAGYDPRCTPVDTLMDAPLGVHLCAAEALTDDSDVADEDDLEGFHDIDDSREFLEVECSRNPDGTDMTSAHYSEVIFDGYGGFTLLQYDETYA